MTKYAGGRASVHRETTPGHPIVYESTDGVSDQRAAFWRTNDQRLPVLSCSWLNEGDRVVFVSEEAARDFFERCLKALRPHKSKGARA